MGTGPKRWTEELIKKRQKAGRGQGSASDYLPWISVQEFSSQGNQTRVPSLVFNRTVHTFSYIEHAMYLYHEFQPGLLDYREQYPMDRSITLGAAKALGIRHPTYPVTRNPVVMTLDALVFRKAPDGTTAVSAWDAKPLAKLDEPRIREKLALHKAYCKFIGIPHYLFTENSVSSNFIANIEWLRGSLPKPGEHDSVLPLITTHTNRIIEAVAATSKKLSIGQFCANYDDANQFERGITMRLFKILLWNRVISVDLNAKAVEQLPLPKTPIYTEKVEMRKAA